MALVEAELVAGPALAELESAKEYFSTARESTSIEEYHYYLRVISKALAIVSAAHFPTELSLRDFTMRLSPQSSQDIFAATTSAENPYVEYYTSEVIPRIRAAQPRLAGFSLAAMSQIIPSFTLAALIKAASPATKIVFGGQVFNRLADRVKETRKLFELVDFFVIHEGETALLSLCEHLEGELPLEAVPNLMYVDPARDGEIRTTRFHVEDVDGLPLPDYSDLDLSRYLSPRLVLPYQPVRGCYWHRCAFCNHHVIHPASARSKSPGDVASDLQQLTERYGTNLFTMVSESIEPKLFKSYAQTILECGLDIKWYAGARADKELTRECLEAMKSSGCVKLYLGLETGSQKVLNEMRKGVRLSDAERILRDCADIGIAVHLFLMIGYPTEAAEDLEASRQEVSRLAGIAPREGFTYYISTFQLKPQTAIFNQPEMFGITLVSKVETGKDLEYLYTYRRAVEGPEMDYEAESRTLEQALDVVQGEFPFPENIVHYLAMRDGMAPSEEIGLSSRGYVAAADLRPDTKLCVRPGLGYCQPIAINSCNNDELGPERQYLVYDLTTDRAFELNDLVAWEALQELSGVFPASDLRGALAGRIGETSTCNATRQERLVADLLASALILPVEQGEE